MVLDGASVFVVLRGATVFLEGSFLVAVLFAAVLFCTPFLLAIVPLDAASPLGRGSLKAALAFPIEPEAAREGANEIEGKSLK